MHNRRKRGEHTVESPFLETPAFLGKTTNRFLYSCSRSTLIFCPSSDLDRRRASTQIPMLLASFLRIPASLSSSMVNPRPSIQSVQLFLFLLVHLNVPLILMLYRCVGHRTAGRSRCNGAAPEARAFLDRATRLDFFLPGWSNWLLVVFSLVLRYPSYPALSLQVSHSQYPSNTSRLDPNLTYPSLDSPLPILVL
jgi:hypothetical protein